MNGPVPIRQLEGIPIPLKRWSSAPSTLQPFALQLAYPIQTHVHMLVGVTTIQGPAYQKQSPQHPIAMKRELMNYCLGKCTDVQLELHISHDKLFTVF